MAITSTIHKVIERIKNASGNYETVYRKTLGELVEFEDGKNAEELQTTVNTHLAENVTDIGGAHGIKVEEGVWTPVIVGSTNAGVNTYGVQYGTYYKIGNLVYIIFDLSLVSKDSAMSGFLHIDGLPFTINTEVVGGTVTFLSNFNLATGYSQISLYSESKTSRIRLIQMGHNVLYKLSDHTSLNNNTMIRGSMVYKA